MRDAWVLVFAKYPVSGAVKTRLAPPLSGAAAAAVQRACLQYVLVYVDRLGPLRRVLVITPDKYVGAAGEEFGGDVLVSSSPRGQCPQGACVARSGRRDALDASRAPHRAAIWPQGDGDFGQRLIRAMRRAFAEGAEKLVFVGTDSPTVAPQSIVEAVRRLEDTDVVIGPCEDGGYYLLATRVPESALFTGIAWGTHRVTEQTRRNAADRGLELAELAMGYDLDRPEDLKRVIVALDGSAAGSPEYALRAALICAVERRAGPEPR